MKKHIIYLLISGFALLSNTVLTSCSDDDTADANDVLMVKSVLPTKVMEGQIVTINGTGLEKATAVVFPGNVSVNNITKVGNGYISVITPAGVSTDGGTITVQADGESAESIMPLTVGKPAPLRVAPLDKEIKINECVEVYGSDLEFITKAYFPGKDGNDIVVNADDFKRKATGSLYIYSPKGIKAGAAQIVIEDCSGKKYTLPEVTLSDEIGGGGNTGNVIWEGEQYTGWWWYLPWTSLNYDAGQPQTGQKIKFSFADHNGGTFCLCDGAWGTVDLGGSPDVNNIWVSAGTKEIAFTITDPILSCMTGESENAFIVGGDLTVTKIEIFQ